MWVAGVVITSLLILRNVDGKRIIHGRRADIQEFPYQASIEVASYHACGGTVVHSLIVITAAHCTAHIKKSEKVTPDLLRVRVGATKAGAEGTIHNVSEVRMHPDFKYDAADVAVLLLAKPIQFNSSVMPIRLARATPSDGEIAWITGYGLTQIMTRRSKTVTRVLRVVRLPIVPIDECRAKLKAKGATVSEGMICAGHKAGHQDACKGDSGGPLVVGDRLAGITAWGLGCGQEGLPGVYTDVANFLPWITSVTLNLLKLYQEQRGV